MLSCLITFNNIQFWFCSYFAGQVFLLMWMFVLVPNFIARNFWFLVVRPHLWCLKWHLYHFFGAFIYVNKFNIIPLVKNNRCIAWMMHASHYFLNTRPEYLYHRLPNPIHPINLNDSVYYCFLGSEFGG